MDGRSRLVTEPTATRPPAQWAVRLARATVACVVPSSAWRVAVGLGADLGWSESQLERQHIPGAGTVYVIVLSVLSLVAAGLTIGLVRPWGERLPSRLGGRAFPGGAVVATAILGASIVGWMTIMSLRNWEQVSGFGDDRRSGWARLMIACYAPAALWAPMLLAVTWDRWRRRRRGRPTSAPIAALGDDAAEIGEA